MLWIGLAIGGLVLLAIAGTILAAIRRRREARAREAQRPAKPIRDAWEESARRLEVEPLEDPDDDDLRVRE
jgi:HAMP domain-containing protein